MGTVDFIKSTTEPKIRSISGIRWLEYKKHAAGAQKYQRCRNRQNMRYHKKYRMHRGVFWHQNNSVRIDQKTESLSLNLFDRTECTITDLLFAVKQCSVKIRNDQLYHLAVLLCFLIISRLIVT